MQFLKFFHHLVLLFTIPTLVVYPEATLPDFQISHQNVSSEDSYKYAVLNNEAFSYDDILDLLEEIEEGSIDERCTPEEIEGINRFIALLAKQGLVPGNIEQEFFLNKDVESLLSSSESQWAFSYTLDEGYSIHPAIFYGQRDSVLCRSWFKRCWDNTRQFLKDHKKAILIGAAVVTAVVITVGVIAIVASTGTAVAAGTTAGASAGAVASGSIEHSPSEEHSNISTRPESKEIVIEPVIVPMQEALSAAAVIEEQVCVFKDQMIEELTTLQSKSSDLSAHSFGESARDFGAALAHKVFDGAAEIVSVVPQLCEEIKEVGSLFVPDSLRHFQPSQDHNPVENYEQAVENGHKAIDQFFGVDHSHNDDSSLTVWPDFSYGILPPPGAIGEIVANEGRIAVTQASSTCGWKVGDPIQNRTFWGGIPKWNTVRSRYWKNQAEWAKQNAHDYGKSNIPRMEKGLAPQRYNMMTGEWESMELHHHPAQRDGGLFDFIEVWPDEHAELDRLRKLRK